MTFVKITQIVIKLFHVFGEFNRVINDIRIAISELQKRKLFNI